MWDHRIDTKAEQWKIPMKFAIAINRIGTIAKGVITIGNYWRRLIASEHKTKFGWWARKGILYVKHAFTTTPRVDLSCIKKEVCMLKIIIIMPRAEVVLYIKGVVIDT